MNSHSSFRTDVMLYFPKYLKFFGYIMTYEVSNPNICCLDSVSILRTCPQKLPRKNSFEHKKNARSNVCISFNKEYIRSCFFFQKKCIVLKLEPNNSTSPS